ncbi:MAG: hypothetical protein ACOZF0_05295 [Thermodesulfobacteriota bacterium]
MSKIYDVSGLNTASPVQKPVKRPESGDFQKVFHQALDSQPSGTASPAAAGSLGEIRLTTVPIVEERTDPLMDQTADLLDQLEQFAQALGDPSRSLKDMESMVTELKKKADLVAENAGVPEGQANPLKRIARESAMTASLEYVKFYRGDYL